MSRQNVVHLQMNDLAQAEFGLCLSKISKCLSGGKGIIFPLQFMGNVIPPTGPRGYVLVQPEMEKRVSPLVSIPPFGRGFSRHGVFRSDGGWGGARTSSHAPVHRLDEPTGISLGMVASPQCPLPFRPAKSL